VQGTIFVCAFFRLSGEWGSRRRRAERAASSFFINYTTSKTSEKIAMKFDFLILLKNILRQDAFEMIMRDMFVL